MILVFYLLLISIQGTSESSLPRKGKEGVLKYEVTMKFNEQSAWEGESKSTFLYVLFNEDFVLSKPESAGPSNWTLENRKTGKKNVYAHFFGRKFEIIDNNTSPILNVEYHKDVKKIRKWTASKATIFRDGIATPCWWSPQIPVRFPTYLKGCAISFSVPKKYGVRSYELKSVNYRKIKMAELTFENYEKISAEDYRNLK